MGKSLGLRRILLAAGLSIGGLSLLTSCTDKGRNNENLGAGYADTVPASVHADSSVQIGDAEVEEGCQDSGFLIEKHYVDTEDSITERELSKRLLVVVDSSGSMNKAKTVLQDMMKFVQKLLEEEKGRFSSVDYLLFNETAELAGLDELSEKLIFRGETSVYNGFEKINEWIREKDSEENYKNFLGVIVFSDMFSSRTKCNSYYTKDIAVKEQAAIDKWAEEWGEMLESDRLSACFIQWESMVEGEESTMSVDNEEYFDYKKGFQVVLKGDKRYALDDWILNLGDINSDSNSVGVDLAEITGRCLEKVLKTITGISRLKWIYEGKIDKWDNPREFGVEGGDRVFIRIDAAKTDNIRLQVSGKAGDYAAVHLLDGEVSQIYMVKNEQQDDLKVSVWADEGDVKLPVYYMVFPENEIRAEFPREYGMKTLLGEKFDILFTVDRAGGEGWDIGNWCLKVRIEIKEDKKNEESIVYDKCFCVSTGEKLSVTTEKAGTFKVYVYSVKADGTRERIGYTKLNVHK